MIDDVHQAILKALEILRKSDHMESELRQDLQRASFSESSIDATLAQLRDWTLLDDDRVADTLAEKAARPRHRGRYRAVEELVRRGVPQDQAEELVAVKLPAETERERATLILTTRFADRAHPAKAARYLASRGFDPELIETLMQEYFDL